VALAIIVWLLVQFGPLLTTLSDPPKPEINAEGTALAQRAHAIIDQVVYRVNKLPVSARWEHVEGDYDDGGFSFQLWFKDDPNYLAASNGFGSDFGTSVVQNDAEEVARAALQELLFEKFSPSIQKINLHVFAERHVSGETGKPLVIEYGRVDYNPFKDILSFHKCDPSALLGC